MAWILGALLGVLPVTESLAAGLRGLVDGWLLDGGDTAFVVTSREINRTETDSQSGLGLWGGAGQTRLYGMEALPVVCLALGALIPSGGWQLGVTWERLGTDLLVEDEFQLALGMGHQPRIGFRLRGNRWMVAAYPSESHLDPSLEFGWSAQGSRGRWEVTLFWHLLEPVPWQGLSGRRPLARAKVIPQGWGLAVALDLDNQGTPHLEFQGLAHLGGGMALGLRADPSTGSLGPVLAWQGHSFLLRTCHTVHPVLGVTHRVTLGFGNPEAAPW